VTDTKDYQINVQTTQGEELSDFEKTRINMSYNLYCEELKSSPNEAYIPLAVLAVSKADALLSALGYLQDE
jgi:hypothetical protein